MTTRLTQHFTLEELCASETARAAGIDNIPDDAEILRRLHETATQMERVRALFDKPVIVSSGYRSPELNRRVGGVATSAHVQGHAVDFTIPAFGSPYDVCMWIAASSIRFDQLIHEKRRWVHISFAPAMRMETLTLPPEGGGYRKGILK